HLPDGGAQSRTSGRYQHQTIGIGDGSPKSFFGPGGESASKANGRRSRKPEARSREGPRVRIRFPPAASLRTFGPSAEDARFSSRLECHRSDYKIDRPDIGIDLRSRNCVAWAIWISGIGCAPDRATNSFYNALPLTQRKSDQSDVWF